MNFRASSVAILLVTAAAASAQPQYILSTLTGGVAPITPAPGPTVPLGQVTAMAFDPASGSIYLTSSDLHCIFRMAPDGTITRAVGTCRPGFSGDNGPAASAQLYYPNGLALDSHGNLYIADTLNCRIRKVCGRIITTVAGLGFQGYTGDGGPATGAAVALPLGVAIGPGDTLLIGDSSNHVVRQINAAGVISTIAGTGQDGSSGDGGPATAARLGYPIALTTDGNGLVYVADSGSNVVRRFPIGGNITIYAGTGQAGFSGDNGPAASAQLSRPSGLAFDSSGNLYITDTGNARVRRVASGGQTITTVAGNGTFGFAGDGGPRRRLNSRLLSGSLSTPTANSSSATMAIIACAPSRRVRFRPPRAQATRTQAMAVRQTRRRPRRRREWPSIPPATSTSPTAPTIASARSLRAASSAPYWALEWTAPMGTTASL